MHSNCVEDEIDNTNGLHLSTNVATTSLEPQESQNDEENVKKVLFLEKESFSIKCNENKL